ncbi:3-dehydroquinate dehydratase [Buchnera aphidicola (Eriosoma grossulariae)]|uniref:type II 3-dehydroquinate dehydratase n=1 Tax=Buchnera aphidicola TaxID=9 RepID=UPI0034645F69
MKNMFNILVLNGPNINLLGNREPQIYGTTTIEKLVTELHEKAVKLNINLSHFQSNAEHELINKIHQSQNKFHYIVINPAAFTHTSIALRDSLLAINIPFIEVHISNIYAREKFRALSWFSDISQGIISGCGVKGYFWALEIASYRLKNKH